jgi:hypothetical protein
VLLNPNNPDSAERLRSRTFTPRETRRHRPVPAADQRPRRATVVLEHELHHPGPADRAPDRPALRHRGGTPHPAAAAPERHLLPRHAQNLSFPPPEVNAAHVAFLTRHCAGRRIGPAPPRSLAGVLARVR